MEQFTINASKILAGYPTADKLFASFQKFVLFFGETSRYQLDLYDYLVKLSNSTIAPYRMLVPVELNREPILFVFIFFSETDKTDVEFLADGFYLKKVILKQKITAKMMTTNNDLSFNDVCSDCYGSIICADERSKVCFLRDFDMDYNYFLETDDDVIERSKKFLQITNDALKFETVDLTFIKWDALNNSPYFFDRAHVDKDFDKVIANFAKQISDTIAPTHAYESNNIALQNQTVVQLMSVIKAFRFENGTDPYLPANLELVFQQHNLTMDGIVDNWRELIKAIRILDVYNPPRRVRSNVRTTIWEYEKELEQNLDSFFYTEKRKQQFVDILNKITHFEVFADYKTDFLLDNLKNTMNQIAEHLIRSVYSNGFGQLLDHLNTLIDANILDRLLEGTQITEFYEKLRKKIDKYFSASNEYKLLSWSYTHVPNDWQSQLVGFGEPAEYWLMPDDVTKVNETILHANITFDEFVSSVAFYFGESLQNLDALDEQNGDVPPVQQIADSKDFKEFFSSWWEHEGTDGEPEPTVTNTGIVVNLLQAKYEQSFANMSFKTAQHIFQKSAHQHQVLLQQRPTLEEFGLRFHIGNLERTFQHQHFNHAQPLFEKFKTTTSDRVMQRMIFREKSTIVGNINRLGEVLMASSKSLFDHTDWKKSQHYKRMFEMKYSLTDFDIFLQEINVLFDSMDAKVPTDEMDYFEALQGRFKKIREQAQQASIVRGFSTHWNWGQGFNIDGHIDRNSGAMLRSPIDVDFRSVSFPNIFLLIVYGVLILFKFFK